MKKIVYLLLLSFVVLLTSCLESTENLVLFTIPESFHHTIGDTKSNYLLNIEVQTKTGTDLTYLVVVDDDNVDYMKTGTYTIYFNLTYQEKAYRASSLVIVSDTSNHANISFNIFYINDLHGALLNIDEQMGLAHIGHLIMDEKEKNEDTTIFLAGGDILQGQLISNWYDGASTIDLLNDMDLDAFVVGNHEFDWGIDVVTQYFNGKNEVQANFPLLGANVYDVATNTPTKDFEPYTIIEKSGIKIAVIGTMGYGLESSIAYPRVKDYTFIDPVERTGFYAKKARVEDGADIVIAVNHADSDYYNSSVANFTGDQMVDVIFNGHTHQSYTRVINNKPVVQSGANGEYVGQVTLNYHVDQGILDFSSKNINQSNEPRLSITHNLLEEKIEAYYLEIAGLYEPIMISGISADRGVLASYIAKLMQERYGADVGLHNYGGTRDSIYRGESLSYAKLHAISPFDNTVVIVELTGSELLQVISNNNAFYKPGLTSSSIEPHVIYKLALNDYIFGANESIREKDATFTGVTVLDLFVESMGNQSLVYDEWTTSLPLMFNENISLFTHLFTYNPQISI